MRTITTTTWVNAHLADRPGVARAFRAERERRANGVATAEVVYGITSRTRGRADAARRLGLIRAHRGIENGLHHVRDGTLREDHNRVVRAVAGLVNRRIDAVPLKRYPA